MNRNEELERLANYILRFGPQFSDIERWVGHLQYNCTFEELKNFVHVLDVLKEFDQYNETDTNIANHLNKKFGFSNN